MTSAAVIAMVAAGGRRSRFRRAVTRCRSASRLLRTPASRQPARPWHGCSRKPSPRNIPISGRFRVRIISSLFVTSSTTQGDDISPNCERIRPENHRSLWNLRRVPPHSVYRHVFRRHGRTAMATISVGADHPNRQRRIDRERPTNDNGGRVCASADCNRRIGSCRRRADQKDLGPLRRLCCRAKRTPPHRPATAANRARTCHPRARGGSCAGSNSAARGRAAGGLGDKTHSESCPSRH